MSSMLQYFFLQARTESSLERNPWQLPGHPCSSNLQQEREINTAGQAIEISVPLSGMQ